jgi:hypothetical protein
MGEAAVVPLLERTLARSVSEQRPPMAGARTDQGELDLAIVPIFSLPTSDLQVGLNQSQ